jgi:hypothetical protein
MPDLDQQIRDLVTKRPSIFPGMTRGSETHLRYKGWSDRTAAALLAILDLHKPEWNGGTQICWYCREGGPGCEAEPVAYPCETVRAIAAELGVEG